MRNGVEMPQSSYSVILNPGVKDAFGNSPGLGLPTYKTIVLGLRDPSSVPSYEVTYYTYSDQCPICLGVGYSDDLALTAAGDLVTTTNEPQLAQSVEKIVITSVQTNQYIPWYGTNLKSLIGTKIVDFGVTALQIKGAIQSSLEDLKGIQVTHLQSNTNVSPSEVLGNILSIDVTQSAADPSVVNVNVTYTNRLGTVLNYVQLLELPTTMVRG
jgi:DNA uptake protein ComE-like DNA-binding protein